MTVIKLPKVIAFAWDDANISHIARHNVKPGEAEEVFSDKRRYLLEDNKHSNIEKRFILIGKTRKERMLFIVFTTREEKIRVISARDTKRKEEILYEKAISVA